MNTVIDARWMAGRVRGMGRFAKQMVAPIESDCLLATTSSTEELVGRVIKKGSSFFPLWEQKTLLDITESTNAEWLLCPYNTAPLLKNSARLILVVHDLIFMESWRELPPSISLYQNLGRLYRRFVVPRAIKKADYLVTVSEYTKHLMVERYGINPECITVIPNALNAAWFSLELPELEERDRYLLTVAGEAPSKNVRRLLESFARYVQRVRNPYSLKIVGISHAKHVVFNKLCKQLGVDHLVHFIGYISDAELKKLYLQARAFIFPSLYEGFGIPLLEAMAAGTPIACSNTTSLPEVVGDAAFLFDPRNCDEMAEAIQRLLEDEALANRLVFAGLEQVKQFSLDRVALRFQQFWQCLGFDLNDK